MTDFAILHRDYEEIVRRVARREHKGAAGVTVDDLEQAIWLFLLENAQHLGHYTAPGIIDLATRTARKYLLKERIDLMHFRGCFIYTPDIVKTYLADALWKEVEDVPDIDGRVDVQREFNKLPLTHRQVLYRTYALGEPPKATDRAGRRMAERAVLTITNNLNLALNARELEIDNV